MRIRASSKAISRRKTSSASPRPPGGGGLEEAIALRERAYAGVHRRRRTRSAARIALTLELGPRRAAGAFAVAGGWFGNAERLLADEPEASEHGFLMLTRALNALFGERQTSRRRCEHFERGARARQALRRPRHRDDRPGREGPRARSRAARSRAGSRCSTRRPRRRSAASSGPTRPGSSTASRSARARTSATSGARRSGRRRRTAGATGSRSRASRARAGFTAPRRCGCAATGRRPSGRPRRRATSCRTSTAAITGGGYYEIGEIRRRQGNFAGAEEAYAHANELGPRPAAGARAAAARAGQGRGRRRRRRRALAERERAADAGAPPARAGRDRDRGRRPRDRPRRRRRARARSSTRTRSAAGGRPRSTRRSTSPAGGSRSAEGDAAAAVACLHKSRDEWQRGRGAVRDRAGAAALGIAFRREGDEHAGTAELEAALAAFERLGARLDEAQRATSCSAGSSAAHVPLHRHRGLDASLLGTLGEDKWKRLLARHNELVRERIVRARRRGDQEHGRRRSSPSFDDPKAAIDAAVAIQRALDAEIVAPDVRIGATAAARSGPARATGLRRAGRPRRCADRRGRRRRRDPRQPRRRSTASAGRSASRSRAPRSSRASISPSRSSTVDWR